MADLWEIGDGEEDAEFLSQLEAAEAEALSLFSSPNSKRRRVSTSTSTSTSTSSSSPINVKSEKQVEEEEGPYMAALRGSKSLAWQKQMTKPHLINTYDLHKANILPSHNQQHHDACYKCGKQGHWANDCSQPSETKPCPCGLGACLLLTANTDRNRGRKFFRCPLRQENGGCGFFEWCDESSGHGASEAGNTGKNGAQQQFYQNPVYQGTSSFTKSRNEYYDRGVNSVNSGYGDFQKSETTDNKGYGMKTSSSCFKCGKEGHWARDCSAPQSSNVTPSYNSMKGNSSFSSSSSNTCYKCGQAGHWAKDCSQTLPRKPQNW